MSATKHHLLTINSGSSSLKLTLFTPTGSKVAAWLVEQPGSARTLAITHEQTTIPLARHDPQQALDAFLAHSQTQWQQLIAVAHRVVHGGTLFTTTTELTPNNRKRLATLDAIAPLHNPPARALIETLAERHPELRQFACFDTVFHQTLPAKAYTLAVPQPAQSPAPLRRYGFHGLSVHWALTQLQTCLDKPRDAINAIVCHLGSGASITQIQDGISVDTSMGYSPQGGLVMASRAGDLDPEVVHVLAEQYSEQRLVELLNQQCGLTAICQQRDLRTIHQQYAHNPDARLAFAVFVKRIRHFLGAYLLELPRVDAIVFTGGIGENDPITRAQVLADLGRFGIKLDGQKNQQASADISALHTTDSPVGVYCIKSDEAMQMFYEIELLLKPKQ